MVGCISVEGGDGWCGGSVGEEGRRVEGYEWRKGEIGMEGKKEKKEEFRV